MAWTKDSGPVACRQSKWKKSRRVTNERLEPKPCVTDSIPSELSFSQQELIRVQCFMGGYKLTDRLIGSGAYAKVYLAEVAPEKMIVDPLMGEIALQGIAPQVAVKIIDKNVVPVGFLKKFLPRELENHTGLKLHQNIVRCFEYFFSGDHVFIILEYCHHGDLLDLINTSIGKHGKCFSRHLMRKIFHQICLGVQHMHKEGIVHRDLKCENILLTKDEDAKITDFGFSCRVDRKDAILKTSCGSYAYAAPEVIRCKPYNGFKADVWSLGVILFAMANGRLPFKEGLVTDVDDQMRHQTLTFNSSVPSECSVLLRKILQYQPEHRLTLDEILNDKWLSDKNWRTSTKRFSKPRWVNSYTMDKKDVNKWGYRNIGESPETSPRPRKKQPPRNAPLDDEPIIRPATWPRRPVIKARATRSPRSPEPPHTVMMRGYLSVAEERERLNRTKARLRIPDTSENKGDLPEWYLPKVNQKNSQPKTVSTLPDMTADVVIGTRENRAVTLQRRQEKVVMLTSIYGRCQRVATLPKYRPRVNSLGDFVKSSKELPTAKSVGVSSTVDPLSRSGASKSPSERKGTLRNRTQTKSCVARLNVNSASKDVPPKLVLVTPIVKQVTGQGRELCDSSCPATDRSSLTSGCGYSQTRSSYLRFQTAKAKVNYQKSVAKTVYVVKPNGHVAKTK